MPLRNLTIGEQTFLRSIFAASLPYDRLQVDRNDAQFGGPTNSITLLNVPHMAITKWTTDFSDSSVSDNNKWTFIHEFGHVWQWCQGNTPQASGVWTGLKMWITLHSYDDAYYYDLSDSSSFSSYNLEQQAAIIADYWFVSNGKAPKYNTGARKSVKDYLPFMTVVTTVTPIRDWDEVKNYANRPDSRPL
jgi:hypothetical protein